MAITIGLAEAKNNFSKVTAEVNRTGRPVTVLKNNRPWVVISPAPHGPESPGTAADETAADEAALDVAVDFMDEYADVFERLAQ